MGRAAVFALFALWFLTTGSSCQTTVNSGRTTIVASDAAAVAGVGVSLVGIGIYCIAYTDECFPDEDALRAQAEAYGRARAAFTAGLRRYRDGDPTGLEWICRSAHQGYARAQYFYGSYLYRQGPEQRRESVMWLSQAAAQGHPEAGVMLRQVAGEAGPPGPSADGVPEMVGPPSVRACAAEALPPRHAALEDGAR